MLEGVTNILVVGIGGQGVMTAAEMLARTALSQGYDVKKTEVAGMAQRGGVVSSMSVSAPKSTRHRSIPAKRIC
jgi:indolepyruvate ferredoxin oxidoreductase beta subunit